MSNNTDNATRESYAQDRLGIPEIGPGSMASLLMAHMDATPRKPIMMIGEPGIGKTAITNQLEESGEYHILTIRLVNEDEGTMNGYADPDVGQETVTLRVVRKVFEAAKEATEKGKKLIVFFDEVNRAKDHMIKYVFNIIDTRRWGDFQLPDNSIFISAINPPTKNHKVRDILSDSALRRRFSLYAVRADNAEYLAYARKSGIHPAVVGYLTSKPKMIYDYDSLDNGKPYACPASWDHVSTALLWYERKGGRLKDIAKDVNLSRMLQGSVGEATTYDFLTYAEDMSKRFSPENILFNYSEIQEEIRASVNAEQTEEDADLDLSKLSMIVRNVATFLADKHVKEDIHLFVKPETATMEKIPAKKVKEYMTMGSNVSKFLGDCTLELFNTFIDALGSEIKEAAAAAGVHKDHFALTSELAAHPEFEKRCTEFLMVKTKVAKLQD